MGNSWSGLRSETDRKDLIDSNSSAVLLPRPILGTCPARRPSSPCHTSIWLRWTKWLVWALFEPFLELIQRISSSYWPLTVCTHPCLRGFQIQMSCLHRSLASLSAPSSGWNFRSAITAETIASEEWTDLAAFRSASQTGPWITTLLLAASLPCPQLSDSAYFSCYPSKLTSCTIISHNRACLLSSLPTKAFSSSCFWVRLSVQSERTERDFDRYDPTATDFGSAAFACGLAPVFQRNPMLTWTRWAQPTCRMDSPLSTASGSSNYFSRRWRCHLCSGLAPSTCPS